MNPPRMPTANSILVLLSFKPCPDRRPLLSNVLFRLPPLDLLSPVPFITDFRRESSINLTIRSHIGCAKSHTKENISNLRTNTILRSLAVS